jgi:acetate kinase
VAVLVLNPGSSTLKYAVYDVERRPPRPPAPREGARRYTGVIEHAGDISRATTEAISKAGKDIDAAGCRVVHGGSRFVDPTRVDDSVLAGIRELSELAPLHNPLAVQVIEEVRSSLPKVPVVAVFDTAFHKTLPPVAMYAVPPELRIRRYGFHGISYSYIASRLQRPRVIVCHLGNGSSICAMRDGKSVDTSMGLTPMEGLVMGTRAGDLDPGALLFLMRGGRSEKDLDDLLNHRCGLLGVSGKSYDVRELEKAAAEGDERCALALDMFAYRVAKYIAAYTAALGGVDALVFTAGIGEHSAPTRRRICERLGFLGIELDPALNDAASKDERKISYGSVEIWVIPTNEELEIARATAAACYS